MAISCSSGTGDLGLLSAFDLHASIGSLRRLQHAPGGQDSRAERRQDGCAGWHCPGTPVSSLVLAHEVAGKPERLLCPTVC